MESIDGAVNGYVVNDSSAPSANVLYSSLKVPPIATAGTIPSITAGNLTLTPYANHQWVAANTFTCPVSGTWMMWINFGINGTYTHVATVNYKINNNAVVTWTKFNNSCETAHVPLKLVSGDKVVFPATASSYGTTCTYCFELVA